MKEIHNNNSSCHHHPKKEYFYRSVIITSVTFYLFHILNLYFNVFTEKLSVLFANFTNIINKMYWGIGLGIIFVGLLSMVSREFVISILGPPGKISSIIKATIAGVLLDLCSHGILLVGMKLYERGASTAQVMSFLIASPWNSFSLTFILIGLIGLYWTLVFILLSIVIAVFSGIIFELLEKKQIINSNPNIISISENYSFSESIKRQSFSYKTIGIILRQGIKDSKMILQWLFFGSILSSFIQTFVSQQHLKDYFGPSILGLFLTLVVTTILEVCSEGATPVAADLLNRAHAPGNAFTFLMAGVSTDYTEILSIKSTTKSWKIALFLPLVTVPQVLILGFILNNL